MKLLYILCLFFPILSFSNVGRENGKRQLDTNRNNYKTYQLANLLRDTQYVPTGVYFLSDKEEGFSMMKDHSSETYQIAKKPFASVKNILRAFAEKHVIENHETYGLTLVFDNEGTKDLLDGTGDPASPYIAIVIANKLLYVVENKAKMKTGLINIILVDYTEQEVNKMLDAINKKL